jgi:hypothetical protein
MVCDETWYESLVTRQHPSTSTRPTYFLPSENQIPRNCTYRSDTTGVRLELCVTTHVWLQQFLYGL